MQLTFHFVLSHLLMRCPWQEGRKGWGQTPNAAPTNAVTVEGYLFFRTLNSFISGRHGGPLFSIIVIYKICLPLPPSSPPRPFRRPLPLSAQRVPAVPSAIAQLSIKHRLF